MLPSVYVVMHQISNVHISVVNGNLATEPCSTITKSSILTKLKMEICGKKNT